MAFWLDIYTVNRNVFWGKDECNFDNLCNSQDQYPKKLYIYIHITERTT